MTKKMTIFYSTSALAIGMVLATLSNPTIASSDCVYLKGCDKKICEIERQLAFSQKNENSHRSDGLARALENAKNSCTDEGLREDLIEDIKEKNEDISEYKADLAEAKEDQRPDKIQKYQDKISKNQKEIMLLGNELSELD